MVAHDVPVANAIAAAVRKTSAGMAWMGKASLKICARYWAVPRSLVTCPRDHANMRIIIARSMAFMPRSQASSASLRERMR